MSMCGGAFGERMTLPLVLEVVKLVFQDLIVDVCIFLWICNIWSYILY